MRERLFFWAGWPNLAICSKICSNFRRTRPASCPLGSPNQQGSRKRKAHVGSPRRWLDQVCRHACLSSPFLVSEACLAFVFRRYQRRPQRQTAKKPVLSAFGQICSQRPHEKLGKSKRPERAAVRAPGGVFVGWSLGWLAGLPACRLAGSFV